jgi:hypothetical protein
VDYKLVTYEKACIFGQLSDQVCLSPQPVTYVLEIWTNCVDTVQYVSGCTDCSCYLYVDIMLLSFQGHVQAKGESVVIGISQFIIREIREINWPRYLRQLKYLYFKNFRVVPLFFLSCLPSKKIVPLI